MACTTILVGKKASWDGSTMIARNDDGRFDAKKLIAVPPEKQPRKYKSVIGHLELDLPDDPLRYTATPNVDPKRGVWAAGGINAANVAMTATETITSNPRVLGADPYVRYEKKGRRETPGGLGEEDLVTVTLPYIRSAREGVARLGKLLETFGTYEANGIAFADREEIWWLETVGGHNWMARRVKDDEYVMMPNQLGIDLFDLADAYGGQTENMCSPGLKELVETAHLDLNTDGRFNPRLVFGSRRDADHVYNTPRAWYIGRYFNPHTCRWDGVDADFTPESDDIPWSLVPERKITVEDVKYILGSHYQGTVYDPYRKGDSPDRGRYRPIGVNRTDVMAVMQLRPGVPEEIAGVEWICFASNTFNAAVPLYANTDAIPDYFSRVTTDVSTENFFWCSRLIGALADPHFGAAVQLIERYQEAVANGGHRIIGEYDAKMAATGDFSLIAEANRKAAEMAKKETQDVLNQLTLTACQRMRNGYSRADN